MGTPGRRLGFHRPIKIWHGLGRFIFVQQVVAQRAARSNVWDRVPESSSNRTLAWRVVRLRGINTQEILDFRALWSRFLRSLEMLSRIIWFIGPQRFQRLPLPFAFWATAHRSHGSSSVLRLERLNLDGDIAPGTPVTSKLFRRFVARGDNLNRKLAVG